MVQNANGPNLDPENLPMPYLILLVFIVIFLLFFTLFTVEQQTVAVVQRFGKFLRLAEPGLNIKIPFVDFVAGRASLRVKQLDVLVETKTHDNVFIKATISVQYQVLPSKVYEAYYKLSDPDAQIRSFVFDVVRARAPKLNLDDVFEKKDEIADAVKNELSQVMDDFGYGIVKALMTDIDPDHKVKEAMNEINSAQRMRVAASEKGEAERILKVKAAEAEAQSKALQGRGIADQRKAIVDGLRASVEEFRQGVPGATAHDVMNLVLMTQFFDTLKDIGASSRTNTIMVPHTPGAIGDLMNQFRAALLTTQPPDGHGATPHVESHPPSASAHDAGSHHH